MLTEKAAPPDRLTGARVGVTLALIALLAVVLPYSAVTTLHHRRLAAAAAQVRALAHALAEQRASNIGGVLVGAGDRPRAVDGRWDHAAVSPLSGLGMNVPPDPWGNAYTVLDAAGAPVLVLSAGPDGILQTPLDSTIHEPLGDDIVARVSR